MAGVEPAKRFTVCYFSNVVVSASSPTLPKMQKPQLLRPGFLNCALSNKKVSHIQYPGYTLQKVQLRRTI